VVIWYILWSFGIFCGHLVYFVVIWYILWSFGIFCGHLVCVFPFWYDVPRIIWHPCCKPLSSVRQADASQFGQKKVWNDDKEKLIDE
jgi:hypothetical protein